MIDKKKVVLWIKTTLKNSFQKAIEKVLVGIIAAIIIIALLLVMNFAEGITMLLTYEVAVLWLVAIVTLFSIAIGIIYHRTSLPKPVEELIIIEKAREPSIHGSNHAYDFPTLRFVLRVINYSYYSFVPKKVGIECYCSGKKVGQVVWNDHRELKRNNSGPASTLPKCGDGSIDCKISVEKKYSNFNNWVINGYVIYAKGKKEYEIKTDLNYTLSESFKDNLKQRVEEALAKERG